MKKIKITIKNNRQEYSEYLYIKELLEDFTEEEICRDWAPIEILAKNLRSVNGKNRVSGWFEALEQGFPSINDIIDPKEYGERLVSIVHEKDND